MLRLTLFENKNMKKNIILFCFFVLAVLAKAQTTPMDTIYKRNGEVMIVKITEIGIDEIKYKPLFNPNDIVLVIEKSQVTKIVFSSGLVQRIEDAQQASSTYADNHKNNLKFNLFSPLGARAAFNFERSYKPGYSYVAGLNLIGLGLPDSKYTPIGATLNGGFRFYRLPDMKNRSDRYSHVMNGSYIEPCLMLGMTHHKYTYYDYNQPYPYDNLQTGRANNFFLAFFINLGKQYIVANRISMDWNVGVGYGTYTGQKDSDSYGNSTLYGYNEAGKYAYNYYPANRYGFAILEKSVPLAFNAQFKIGYLFH